MTDKQLLMITCKKCSAVYEQFEGNFQKDHRIKSGFRGCCKSCMTKSRKQNRLDNIEKEKEYSNNRSREYYYFNKQMKILNSLSRKFTWQEPHTKSFKDLIKWEYFIY